MNSMVLNNISYGMYAIGVKDKDKISACIANTVAQVSAFPEIIAVSINRENYTNSCIKKTGIFTVSVLSEDTDPSVIGNLGFKSGKEVDKLKNLDYKLLDSGLPVIEKDSSCYFSCKVIDSIEVGTHTVFVAEVTSTSDDFKKPPMTYSYYHRVIKGSAPKNAPTYRGYQQKSDKEYTCTVCGYAYDGKIPFESLHNTWVCPICGAPKSVFVLK